MNKFMKDDIVKHKTFGIGKVLDIISFYKIEVKFVDVGKKLLDTNHAKLKLLEGEEAIHPELDNL